MYAEKKKMLEDALASEQFKKSLRLAQNVERLVGGGLKKKIQRLFITSSVYIPYLLMVRSHLYRRASVTARLFWGRTIQLPLQDYDSLALSRFGFAGGTEAELKLARFLVANLKPKDVFYDVGANYGFFTYLASELCKEVHSFEPIPSLAEVVAENSKEYKVQVNSIALSDIKGTAQLHTSESTGLSTLNAAATTIHTYTYDASKIMSVPTTTLDEYVANHAAPTFIKIDVEGGEEAVIRGGENFLRTHSPIVCMEVWGKENGGAISMAAVELLRSFGYISFSINAAGNINEVSGDVSLIVPANGVDNFVFKKGK